MSRPRQPAPSDAPRAGEDPHVHAGDPPRHRRCVVLRGEPEDTAATAGRLLAGLAPGAALWIGDGADAGAYVTVRPARVQTLLGRSFDAVVLDLHRGLDPDVLGQCHGFVWGGGALILRMPPPGVRPLAGRDKLAPWPHRPEDVGARFWDRFERVLARADLAPPAPGASLTPVPRAVRGNAEQAAVAARLAARLAAPRASASVLLADRGRGKSSALGMALREAATSATAPLRVAVTAGHEASADEVFRFAAAGDAASTAPAIAFVPATDLLEGPADYDVIVIDEAAQLPVPLLQAIVARHRRARFAFATTTRGYEGTGRGFALRFLAWLEGHAPSVEVMTLSAPIRWDAGDPLERLIFDALLLDAEPARITAPTSPGRLTFERLDRDALAGDEAALRELFGLLVHAHYRTTASDLYRLLDAPNLAVHVARDGARVVAATLVAEEGGLPPALVDAALHGRERLRAHALPDALVAHLGHGDAGAMRMIRSVRIAVHPATRRAGVASALVDHIHASYAPDLFGTLFGATAGLIAFRRALGYELVRVSASRGARTGEPAALMLRPVTPRARALLTRLRLDLARELPAQLQLFAAGHELLLDPALEAALLADLPPAPPLTDAHRRAQVAAYVYGPRIAESVITALTELAIAHVDALAALSPTDRALIEGRVLCRRAWSEVARAAGLPSTHVAMRAHRRAFRAFVERVDPTLAAAHR